MGLQLKGEEQDNSKKPQNNSMNALDKKHEDPWGNKDIEDDFYEVNAQSMAEDNKNKAMWKRRSILGKVFQAAVVILVIAIVVVIGVYVDKIMHPTYAELSDYILYDEEQLSKELDIQLTKSDKWMSDIFWWVSDREINIYADEDVGVFYFDNRQMGIHIHTDKYKLFGMQVGLGDKAALDGTTYKYDDYFCLYDDYHNGKNTTTYYYYNTEKNDCIALTKDDEFNMIKSITYINNYQYFASHIGKMNVTH